MPSQRTRTDRRKLGDLLPFFTADLQSQGRAATTIRNYHRAVCHLKVFLLTAGIKDDVRLIGKELIVSYMAHAERTLKLDHNGKAEWIGRLRLFFQWLNSCGFILRDPFAGLELPKMIRRKYPVYVTQGEMVKLLESIKTDTPEGLQDRAMLELLYSSGLRAGELCRLSPSDIDFAEGTALILLSKCKKDRVVPVGRIALFYLRRFIREVRALGPGPLFCNASTGRALAPWMIRAAIRRHAAAAALPKNCIPRIFRHSFAIHLLEGGASIRHIQAMMGHADLRTTQRYTRIVPEELKRIHRACHPAERRSVARPIVCPVLFRARKLPPDLCRSIIG